MHSSTAAASSSVSPNANNKEAVHLDVDDVIWVVMNQWTKMLAWYTQHKYKQQVNHDQLKSYFPPSKLSNIENICVDNSSSTASFLSNNGTS